MPPITRAKVAQDKQAQGRQSKKSRSSRSSGSMPKRTKNNTKKAARYAPAPNTQAVPQKEPGIHRKTAAQRADRNARDARRLAAVSGVVIPSKVSPGQLPDQGQWQEDERTIYPCSICGRKFVRKNHVQVHMAACVKRNGNPTGARWDDAWRNGASQVVSVNVHPNEDEDLQMEDDEPEEYQHEDDDPEDVDPEDDQSEDRRSQSADLDFTFSSNDLAPYDPSLRMDILTNEALFSMVQAWQDAIQYGGGSYTVEHPHFQRIMEELWRRNMVDEKWTWIVDVERVNMNLRRVMVGESRI